MEIDPQLFEAMQQAFAEGDLVEVGFLLDAANKQWAHARAERVRGMRHVDDETESYPLIDWRRVLEEQEPVAAADTIPADGISAEMRDRLAELPWRVPIDPDRIYEELWSDRLATPERLRKSLGTDDEPT